MIYINIFIHYPETYNETIISDKIKENFNDYDFFVKVKSAPHSENEMIVIENKDLINEEKIIKIRDFILNYLEIKDILIK